MTTAIFIDPHVLVRKSIIRMLCEQLPIKIVADVNDGPEGLAAFEKHSPGLVITETQLPYGRGMEIIKAIKERKGKTIALSVRSDDVYVIEALKAGALGYVLKQGPPEDLCSAIMAVTRGEPFLSNQLRSCAIRVSLNKSVKIGDAYERLTPRERSVLRLAAEGLACTEIGKHLFISRRTVETHRANLMHKLGLKSQTDLIKAAMRHGVISI